MNFRESNTEVIFIPTDIPCKRTCSLRSKKELESLPEDSTDVFQISILQKYAARPLALENCCPADFVANYGIKDGQKIL